MDYFSRALLQNDDLQPYENMEQQMRMQTDLLKQMSELQARRERQELTHELGSALGSLGKTFLETFL